MAKIQMKVFKGRNPKIAKHLLQPENAQIAINTRMETGDVRSWKAPVKEQDLTAATYKTLYRYDYASEEDWIADTADIDFVRAPLTDDTWERVYFTGHRTAGVLDEPRYLSNDNVSDPFDITTDFHKLGIIQAKETIEVQSGYTTGTDFRAYYYTYVSAYGEEGAPSSIDYTPAAGVAGAGNGGWIEDYDDETGDSVTLKGFVRPVGNGETDYWNLVTASGTDYPYVYVYRTNSDSTSGDFQYVGKFRADNIGNEAAWTAKTFTDEQSNLELGEICSSEGYDPPDEDLIGLIGLPNGIFAAFKDNELWFSEHYQPHAWPTDYAMAFNEDIIGLGVYGTSIIVMTEGYPYQVSGYTPSAMTKMKFTGFYPCLSKRGIVMTPDGVMYPAPEGLILVNQNGPQNIIEDVLEATDWDDFYPTTHNSNYFEGKYFASYSGGDTGGLMFDISSGQFYEVRKHHYARWIEPGTGNLYVIQKVYESGDDVAIYEWEGDPYNYLFYEWKSKEFILDEAINFSVAEVLIDYDFYDDILTAEEDNSYLQDLNDTAWTSGILGGEINGDLSDGADLATVLGGEIDYVHDTGDDGTLGDRAYYFVDINGDIMYSLVDLTIHASIFFNYYVDGELKHTETISLNNDRPFKLPKGFKGRKHEVKVSGYIPVKQITLATSEKEL